MARLDKVASRYAKAIFLSEKGKDLRGMIDELSGFAKVVEGNKDLSHVLGTELFPVEKKREIVEDLSAKLKVSQKAKQVLIVLAEMRRLGSLSAIAERLHRLTLEAASIIPLHVETATDLSKDQKEKIEARFAKILGKKVEANYVSDPTLIGGLKVTAEGRTFDGSVSGWLNTFGEQLVEATV